MPKYERQQMKAGCAKFPSLKTLFVPLLYLYSTVARYWLALYWLTRFRPHAWMPRLPREGGPLDSPAVPRVLGGLLAVVAHPLLGQGRVLPLQRGRVPLAAAPLLLRAALLLVVVLLQVRKLPLELVHSTEHNSGSVRTAGPLSYRYKL